jgi:hypothetical protein
MSPTADTEGQPEDGDRPARGIFLSLLKGAAAASAPDAQLAAGAACHCRDGPGFRVLDLDVCTSADLGIGVYGAIISELGDDPYCSWQMRSRDLRTVPARRALESRPARQDCRRGADCAGPTNLSANWSANLRTCFTPPQVDTLINLRGAQFCTRAESDSAGSVAFRHRVRCFCCIGSSQWGNKF